MKFDTVIIGGGASGLCTAIKAKKNNNSILIIDKESRPGKKILSTGNGKCNLTNTFCKTSLFDSNPEGLYPYFSNGGKDFIEAVIRKYDCDSTIDFFKSLGMLLEDKNGYIYPRSEQASDVLDILKNTCKKLGIEIMPEYKPEKIRKCSSDKNGFRFCIDDKIYCKNLVIACGGMSAPKLGSDGSGYEYAGKLGHSIIKPRPALCAVKCREKYFKDLQGVRNDSSLTVYNENDEAVAYAYGNLQLTAYGISGIPVFQLSSIIGEMLENGEKIKIKIDFLPEYSKEELRDHFEQKKDDLLLGVINKKIGSVALKELDKMKSKFGDRGCNKKLGCILKGFKVTPYELNDFENSQVTAGGIPTDEICSETMESKLVPGLYFTGEIIDVNGICGGYNLQWAWSTAFVAADAISLEM